MMFKGTEKRTALQISDDMDAIGAQVNAFTGKDLTCYYTKATTAHAEEAFAILADFFLHSTFPEEEMVREKGVICEEIAMNEDTPDDLCMDELARAFYGETGYGRNILGSPKNVNGFTKEDIAAYMKARYTSENIVISMAGNIDIATAERMTEEYFAKVPKSQSQKRDVPIVLKGQSLVKHKKIEQVHIGIAFPSVKRYDRLMDAAQIMNAVFGGSMSSRLFQTVREKMGLAYTVYSYLSAYNNVGSLVVYAGVNAKNYLKSVDAIYSCIHDIQKKTMTQDEFSRGKEQLISSSIYAQESTSSQMLLYGKELLYSGKIYDFEKRIGDIEAVTLDNVYEVIDSSFQESNKAIAVVGNVHKPLAL
jgi:predicted Zn-dependent peptidase